MFKNYFKTAWRNLWKNKSFSAINILGLALGMTCSLLIMLWVQDEKKVDAFHANTDRLYNVYEIDYNNGRIEGARSTPALLGDELKRVIPDIEYSCNMAWDETGTFMVGDKILKQEGNHAGEDFFRIFSFPLLQGNAKTALNDPLSISISRKMATAFFGSPAKAFNQTIRYGNWKDFKITAVYEDMPANSSMKCDFVLNWKFFLQNNSWGLDWTNNGPRTYFKLKQDANPKLVAGKLHRFLDKYNKEQTATTYVRLGIQRFDEMYLNSNFKNGQIEGGRIEYVRIFGIVAIFILLIACINFMNLTTARSVKRAKEIGVRKVVGAARYALLWQFIGEAVLIAFMAAAIALLLASIVLPVFNNLTGKHIVLPFANVTFWISVLLLTIVTGFISGSYPAVLLSSFKPVTVLKGKLRFGASAGWLRKGLVVFQFVLSVLLIVGMIVIAQQVNYIQSKNIGYDRNNLIYIPLDGDLTAKYSSFKEEILKQPGIAGISRMTHTPTSIGNSTSGVDWTGKDPNIKPEFTYAFVGYDFAKTLHAQILEGREFSKEFADTASYILNEAAVKQTGYKDPIGKPFSFWNRKGTIVGVVKDFHFNSLHVAIEPLVLSLGEKDGWGSALVRAEQGKTKQALASLEKICKNLNPNFPFTYRFSDDEFKKVYTSELVINKLSNYFAFLAIFISCMGLLGLVMFTAEQRTREIGIRKVLGASIGSLFTLLSKEFLLLVALAFVIASPLAWWMMNSWLQNFEYREPIHWWIFVIAGISAAAIALVTVSFQAIKSALANPVKSLRSE